MRIRLRDRLFLFLIKFADMLQGGLLKNYAIFAFVARHAPQKWGAEACCYRAFKEFCVANKYVPAYRDFLRQNNWSTKLTDANEVFKTLPVTDKPNYILSYRKR